MVRLTGHNGIWLFNNRLVIQVDYVKRWLKGGLCLMENGGRQANECLDLTIVIGKLNVNLTFFGVGILSWGLRWIPRPRRSGYQIGWLPYRGGNDDA